MMAVMIVRGRPSLAGNRPETPEIAPPPFEAPAAIAATAGSGVGLKRSTSMSGWCLGWRSMVVARRLAGKQPGSSENAATAVGVVDGDHGHDGGLCRSQLVDLGEVIVMGCSASPEEARRRRKWTRKAVAAVMNSKLLVDAGGDCERTVVTVGTS